MKAVLVTGANAGIGLALAKLLATEDRCRVFLGSRSIDKGQAARESIVSLKPDAVVDVVQLDVQDSASVSAAAAAVKASLGTEHLYAIVNNAGAGLAHGVTADTIVDTNLHGVKSVCDAFVPLLSPSEGRVVNVGSGIGPAWMSRAAPELQSTLCSPQVTWDQVTALASANLATKGEGENGKKGAEFNAYGLSKACLMSLTTILAREHPNLLCSTLSPGFIDTAMTKGFGAKLTPEQGTVSARHCLFAALGGNGWMYGSDAKRAPIDASRDPGDPEYTDPTGRGW